MISFNPVLNTWFLVLFHLKLTSFLIVFFFFLRLLWNCWKSSTELFKFFLIFIQLTNVSKIKQFGSPEEEEVVDGNGLSGDLQHGAFLTKWWEGVGELKLEFLAVGLATAAHPVTCWETFSAVEANNATDVRYQYHIIRSINDVLQLKRPSEFQDKDMHKSLKMNYGWLVSTKYFSLL